MVDVGDFDPNGIHKDTNNLYFLEPQFIFSQEWITALNAIPQQIVHHLRHRHLAMVLWFPHEGINYYQGFHAVGWLHHFHMQMRAHQLEESICYFVFGVLLFFSDYC